MSEQQHDPRHPEDYCHRCQGSNISWYTPGGVWDPVMRPVPGEPWKWNEIICPPCFVELAGGGTWALIPMKDDGEQWTSADERERISADAYARGAAEQAAKVEAVLDRHPYYLADAVRAALASEGTDALAKIRADALREAVEQDAITIPDMLGYKVAAVAVEDLLDRADRIEVGDSR